MSLLVPESGLLFWMLLSFGIVFFILFKFGFPVITGMVEKRKEYIDESLEAAREANRQLSDLKTETETMLEQAREERTKILNEAVAEHNRILTEARTKAEEEGRKLLEETRKQIQLEKDSVLRDLRRQVAILSVDIAEKVLRKDLEGETAQMEMIDRLLDDVKLSNHN